MEERKPQREECFIGFWGRKREKTERAFRTGCKAYLLAGKGEKKGQLDFCDKTSLANCSAAPENQAAGEEAGEASPVPEDGGTFQTPEVFSAAS